MDATMGTNQKVTGTFKPTSASGADTSAQFSAGSLTWEASDPSIVQLVPSTVDLSVSAVALGVVGSVTVTATGVDAAGRSFVATGTITVVPAVEVTAQAALEFSPPLDQ